MPIVLGAKSLSKLVGVHPDLVRVVKRAASISTVDFTVLEGVRTVETQRAYVARGASTTMNSRHIPARGFSHAVDIAPIVGGKVSWDWAWYHKLEPIMKQAAKLEKVPLEWGGDWKSFKDGPHWQLPFAQYPK